MSNNQTGRIAYWDNLKAIMIFLVVTGHFLIAVRMRDTLLLRSFYYIYIFHMPAFVFVSGYFGKRYIEKGAPQFGKLLGYAILYILFKFLIWLENGLLYGEFQKLDFFTTDNASWYMFAMLVWFIVLPVFAKLGSKLGIGLALLISILAPLIDGLSDFLCLNRISILVFFFVAGYYFKEEWIYKLKKPLIKVCAVLFLIVMGVVVYFNYDLITKYGGIIYTNHSYWVMNQNILMPLIMKGVWLVVASLMILSIMILCPTKKMVFTYIGVGTLSIYILHILIRDALLKYGFFDLIGKNKYTLLFGCILIALVLVFVLAEKHIAKIFNWAFKIIKDKR